MLIRKIFPALIGALLLSAFPRGWAATDKSALERIDPVPAGEPIPLVDFFRPALLRAPALNPAGTHVAALITASEDRYSLMVYNLEKKTMETIHGAGDKDVYSFVWLDNKRLISTLAQEKLWGLGLFASEADWLSKTYPLLQFTGVRLVSVPRKDRTHPLVWVGQGLENGADDIGVARINAAMDLGPMLNLSTPGNNSGEGFNKVRENNRRHIVSSYPRPKDGVGSGYYIADKDGELAYCVTGRDGFQKLNRLVGDRWLPCPVDLDQFDLMGVGNKPNELVVLPHATEGKPRPLQVIDATTGALGEVLLQDKAYDAVANLYRDPRTGDILGASYQRSGPQAVWFDATYRAVQKKLEASFPGQVVQVTDMDESGRLLVAAYSDRQPAIFYHVDLEKRAISLIKNSAPWIDPARMQPMNVMKFKTRDGHQLDAYVTLPAGASKKNPVPLVVLPHGGPWARDNWGYNGEVQFLASRGYAVMQPNYRGSTGYDWMFPEEDRYAFRKMHDDVTDATKTLLAAGLVDPNRVAIMGGSFGAYLALSGVVHEPNLYRCAVTISGVFDWETVMAEEKYYQNWDNNYAYMKRKLGDPKAEKEKFTAISPLRFVSQMHVPIFVWHGKDDPTADIGESRRLISELEKYRIPHEVMLVGGEGHGSSYLKNRLELYERIETFLAKNLAPTKAP